MTKRHRSSTNLAWLDLEMTGLDPAEDVILQVALIITDKHLNPLNEFVSDVWQPESALARMTPFVRAMHEKTGLLDRVRAEKKDTRTVEHFVLERLSDWCDYPATLCGNSVGTDKLFVDRWMPGLGRYFSYRIVDVSSIKVLARLWYGDTAVFVKPEEGAHDALVDIRNSIAELAHYRATLMKKT